MQAILLTSDLATASKAAGAAARAGGRLETSLGVESLLAKAGGRQIDLVVLDLTTPGLEPVVLVPRLRALSPPPAEIIAFGPHVQESLLAAALDAGCDRVLTRGQFHAQADELFKKPGELPRTV